MARRKHHRQILWYLLMGGGLVLAGSVLVRMGTAPTDHGDRLETVPPGPLSSFAQQASPKAQEVYRYAVDHGETLQYIPCFCGCANLGHRHNGDCYIAERLPGGSITFNQPRRDLRHLPQHHAGRDGHAGGWQATPCDSGCDRWEV
jgi:hypothetical protein